MESNIPFCNGTDNVPWTRMARSSTIWTHTENWKEHLLNLRSSANSETDSKRRAKSHKPKPETFRESVASALFTL